MGKVEPQKCDPLSVERIAGNAENWPWDRAGQGLVKVWLQIWGAGNAGASEQWPPAASAAVHQRLGSNQQKNSVVVSVEQARGRERAKRSFDAHS